ncbi:hypothetical protein [Micromonospora sp. b486]|uniref:hypothetical protein n=1 Tax=Micromonospora sp. b486 TaxID=3053986 RepID=UPI00259D1087|nr:hypothetical protein [Micromonospora sp. b486]MDM4784585.1 hypothetical protein [Micromonospora sp. b486]
MSPDASPELLADPATYVSGPPWREFARRRAEAPVAWVREPALRRRSGRAGDGPAGEVLHRGDGYWAVTRYDSVVRASRDPALFSSATRGPFLADPKTRGDLQRTRQLLAGMDPPGHTRLRRVLTAAFTPRTVRALQDSIDAHAAGSWRRRPAGVRSTRYATWPPSCPWWSSPTCSACRRRTGT